VRFLANPLSTHRGFTPRMGTLSVRFEESTLFFTHLREHRSHLATAGSQKTGGQELGARSCLSKRNEL
jgi:hypothetical protein